ncbi:MAG TPA: hypothetical protein VF622_08565 [Segetibacter sp.]|jgi:hypothetical protein
MKRNLLLVTTFILIALTGSVIFFTKSKTITAIAPAPDSEMALSFFIDTVTSIVQATVVEYEKLGLARGVDGFVLVKTLPKLLPSDFIDVRALGGEYSVEKGELLYTGNMASNSAVLLREGMRTLLKNCSQRLKLPSTSKEGVIQIISQLEGAQQSR